MNHDEDLNRALALWAGADPVQAGDDAATARMIEHGRTMASLPASRPTSRWWQVAGGGAVAASVAVALLGLTIMHRQPARPGAQAMQSAAPLAAAGDGVELTSFALLHVPTDEEEDILI